MFVDNTGDAFLLCGVCLIMDICGIFAIHVNLTGNMSVVSDFVVDAIGFECVGDSAVRR